MPLASSLPLSEHFTSYELGADKPEANNDIVTNLRETAAGLERFRQVLQSRLQVNTPSHRNRGFRTPTENDDVGGSPTSDHVKGLSADFVALDFPGDMIDAYQTLKNSGALGDFDQVIFYPLKNYIHAGFDGSRKEFRVHFAEATGGTPVLGSNFAQQLGGAVTYAVRGNPVAAIALLAAVIFSLVALNRK